MHFLRRSYFFFLLICAAFSLQAQTTPAILQPLPAQALTVGGGKITLDLKKYIGLPGVTGPVAQIETTLGKLNVELLADDTPKSVANFLGYVDRGAYENTLFHRSVPGFVIQAGGYGISGSDLTVISTVAPVQNEFKNSNVRGTLAMAKTADGPNSATSQWFINLADNSANLDNQNGGFTVFARVLGTGMTVADSLASVPAYDASSQLGGPFNELPLLEPALNPGALLLVKTIKVVPILPLATSSASVLSLTASSSISGIVIPSIGANGELVLSPIGVGTTSVSVVATDTNGNSITGLVPVTVAAGEGPPTIIGHPQPLIAVAQGTSNTVVFSVVAVGAPAPTYQWRRNGSDLSGKTAPTCVLSNATEAQAGDYTCVVKNSFGSVESFRGALVFVPATNPGKLINLSILTNLTAGDSLTMGSVLGGNGTIGSKSILVRAAGPSLTQLGVTDVLPDPKLNLVASGTGTTIGANDDWQGTAALSLAFAQVGAFSYASPSSKDAAIFQQGLAPGNYTVKVSDAGSGTGAVIAEIYDSTSSGSFTASTPRLINVSVLKQIPTGTSLTAGFVIGGTTSRTVLVRAIGPGLAQFGFTDFMPDPQLTLFTGAIKTTENDNWGGDAQLVSVGASIGAFALPSLASKDAILLLTLAPGSYSAQVSGNGGGGQAIVEVYEVP